jgi:hypothetical protein
LQLSHERRDFGEAVAAATARHMEYEGNWR